MASKCMRILRQNGGMGVVLVAAHGMAGMLAGRRLHHEVLNAANSDDEAPQYCHQRHCLDTREENK